MKQADIWMAEHDLAEGKQVQGQMKRVERLYADTFSEGNLHVAIGELTSQILSVSEETISYDHLKLGYRLGMGATFGLWMLWDCLIQGLKHGGPSFVTMMLLIEVTVRVQRRNESPGANALIIVSIFLLAPIPHLKGKQLIK